MKDMKQIMLDIVNRLSDVAASLDSLEAALIRSGKLTADDIDSSFPDHKANCEQQVAWLRASIRGLPESSL